MEHHQFQGDRDMDMDLPTVFEGEHVTSVLSKTAWVFLMPLIYGARPQHVRPKTHRFIDNVNICIIVCTNAIIYTTCGPRGLLYLVLSTVLGMGIHPIAGHFIAEHFVFVKDYETYSYYGHIILISTLRYNHIIDVCM
jgi:sphingolipid delta-4 desaturase